MPVVLIPGTIQWQTWPSKSWAILAIKTRELGWAWNMTRQGRGATDCTGQREERWIFPLLKGELNSWTDRMCFPVFRLPPDSPKAVGGWCLCPFPPVVFTDLHFERLIVESSSFFPTRRGLCSAIKSGWEAKPSYFRSKFGPPSKTALTSFSFNWLCFLP